MVFQLSLLRSKFTYPINVTNLDSPGVSRYSLPYTVAMKNINGESNRRKLMAISQFVVDEGGLLRCAHRMRVNVGRGALRQWPSPGISVRSC